MKAPRIWVAALREAPMKPSNERTAYVHFSMPEDWLCCGYLRKSREDEERDRSGKSKDEITKETLARHKRIIEGLARNYNHEISRWYTEVKSGETIADRDEIKLLLADIAAEKWDAVYVIEASRLGRGGGGDQEKIVNALRYTNTWLLTEEKVYDPNSKSDMKQLKNELRNSEDELDSITTRLTRGKISSAEEGRWLATGRPPYGWKAVRIKGLWQLRPDENHCHMLRIYDLLEDGYGYSTIAGIYNREHVPLARGGFHWTTTAIRAISSNPANCGYVRYSARKVTRVFDPDTFEVSKRRVKNENPIIAKGLHYGTGGIEKERFDRILKMHTDSARVHVGKELKNPLAGLLRCGKCGYAMEYQAEKTYYQHRRRDAMVRECGRCRGAQYSLIVDVLAETLKRTIDDVELKIGSNDSIREHEQRLSSLYAALKKAEAARKRAMEAFENGIYSIDDLKESKEKADNRIKEIEKEIAESKPPQYTPETIFRIHQCIDLIKDDNVSAQAKNDFLKTIISRIDYYNDTELYISPNVIKLDIFFR